ncbi:hypothetical protein U1Q18_034145 [Sarracenia purpurea var. burkii]
MGKMSKLVKMQIANPMPMVERRSRAIFTTLSVRKPDTAMRLKDIGKVALLLYRSNALAITTATCSDGRRRRVWRSAPRRSSSFSIAVFASAAAGSIEATISEPGYRSPRSERRRVSVLKSKKSGVELRVGRNSDSGLDLNPGGEKKEVTNAESLAAGVSS